MLCLRRKTAFSVSGIRPYSMSLPQCSMFWVWWVWSHSNGLPTYLLQGHLYITIGQNLTVATTPDQPHATIMRTGRDVVGLDLNPILTNITAKVAITPMEGIPGHTTGIIDDITGVVHNAHTQPLTHIILTMTLQITDHLCKEAFQLTPGIAADYTLDQPTNPSRKPHTNLPQGKAHTKRNSRALSQ